MIKFNGNFACSVYEELFKECYDSKVFRDRIKMQKMLYILKAMRYVVGNYKFVWFERSGVYSADLHEELHQIIKDDAEKMNFSKFDKKIFEKFKFFLEVDYSPYTEDEWLDAISSLIYLSEHHYFTEEMLLADLERRRTKLINPNTNKIAFDILKSANLFKNIHLINS